MKLWLVASLLLSVAAGCGSASVSEQYPLESVNQAGSDTSYVYRAAGETVPEVAQAIAEQKKPKQMSPADDERMFLVYDDEWYDLQRDPEQPDDTLIEVSNLSYVQHNYNPSFLEGYLLASVIHNLFDSVGSYGNYRGYTSKDTYKPKTEYRQATDADRKQAPPLTVNRKGSIVKRDASKAGSAASVGSSGGLFKKESGKGVVTKGSIGSGSKPKSGSWLAPKRITVPRTKVGGFGKITRRR